MPSHNVHLHQFLRPDHWDVADIWIASWDSTLPAMTQMKKHDWVFHQLEDLHEQGAVTLCALNKRTGGIAGFVTFNPARSEVMRIAVATSARGAGVATTLLDRAKALAPDGLRATIAHDNSRALRFFAREGFAQAGTSSAHEMPVTLHWQNAAQFTPPPRP